MNKNILIYYITTVIVLLITSSELSARTAKILYLKAPTGAVEEAFIYQSREDKELGEPIAQTLPRNNFSATFTLEDGPLKLVFTPKPIGIDEELPSNAPVTNIPAGWQKVLLLVFNNPENKFMPITVRAVNADTSKFNLGDLMFINMTNSIIAGKIDGKTAISRPQSMSIVKKPKGSGEEYAVTMNRLDEERELVLPILSQPWRGSDHQSNVVFFLQKEGSDVITYYTAPVRDL
ncbi:hypothetical protein OAB00_01875 [Akkermansiaceae bacterium]|nr:hypothetical protein [Akkermansiaceae bacterium]